MGGPGREFRAFFARDFFLDGYLIGYWVKASYALFNWRVRGFFVVCRCVAYMTDDVLCGVICTPIK